MTVSIAPSPCGGTKTNFSIAAGETLATVIAISIGATPMNLTGYAVKMQVAFPTPLVLNTSNGGINILSGNQFQISVPDTVTDTLPTGPYPYDLWVISPDGAARRILFGVFTVIPAITPVP